MINILNLSLIFLIGCATIFAAEGIEENRQLGKKSKKYKFVVIEGGSEAQPLKKSALNSSDHTAMNVSEERSDQNVFLSPISSLEEQCFAKAKEYLSNEGDKNEQLVELVQLLSSFPNTIESKFLALGQEENQHKINKMINAIAEYNKLCSDSKTTPSEYNRALYVYGCLKNSNNYADIMHHYYDLFVGLFDNQMPTPTKMSIFKLLTTNELLFFEKWFNYPPELEKKNNYFFKLRKQKKSNKNSLKIRKYFSEIPSDQKFDFVESLINLWQKFKMSEIFENPNRVACRFIESYDQVARALFHIKDKNLRKLVVERCVHEFNGLRVPGTVMAPYITVFSMLENIDSLIKLVLKPNSIVYYPETFIRNPNTYDYSMSNSKKGEYLIKGRAIASAVADCLVAHKGDASILDFFHQILDKIFEFNRLEQFKHIRMLVRTIYYFSIIPDYADKQLFCDFLKSELETYTTMFNVSFRRILDDFEYAAANIPLNGFNDILNNTMILKGNEKGSCIFIELSKITTIEKQNTLANYAIAHAKNFSSNQKADVLRALNRIPPQQFQEVTQRAIQAKNQVVAHYQYHAMMTVLENPHHINLPVHPQAPGINVNEREIVDHVVKQLRILKQDPVELTDPDSAVKNTQSPIGWLLTKIKELPVQPQPETLNLLSKEARSQALLNITSKTRSLSLFALRHINASTEIYGYDDFALTYKEFYQRIIARIKNLNEQLQPQAIKSVTEILAQSAYRKNLTPEQLEQVKNMPDSIQKVSACYGVYCNTGQITRVLSSLHPFYDDLKSVGSLTNEYLYNTFGPVKDAFITRFNNQPEQTPETFETIKTQAKIDFEAGLKNQFATLITQDHISYMDGFWNALTIDFANEARRMAA